MSYHPPCSYIFSPYYQSSFVIQHNISIPCPLVLDFLVSSNSSFGPDYSCSNCQCYGFPCANCKDYIIDGKPLLLQPPSDEFIIDFSEPPSFSSMTFIEQIDFIASRKIAWVDVPDED